MSQEKLRFLSQVWYSRTMCIPWSCLTDNKSPSFTSSSMGPLSVWRHSPFRDILGLLSLVVSMFMRNASALSTGVVQPHHVHSMLVSY